MMNPYDLNEVSKVTKRDPTKLTFEHVNRRLTAIMERIDEVEANQDGLEAKLDALIAALQEDEDEG